MGPDKAGISIVSVGEVPGAALEAVRKALEEAFKKNAAVAGGVPVPEHALSKRRGQYNSTLVLGDLMAISLPGLVLGVADVDLFARGLNFVFGEAAPEGRAALISLRRLRQEFYGRTPDEGLFLKRAAKEAVHEVGHLLGLAHCPHARCVMHFSNSLPDTDIKGAGFCRSCRGRLDKNG